MKDFTYRQQRFVDEYLRVLNATQAAIKAGYSAKTARQIGQRLLSNVDIKREIDLELAKIHDRQQKQIMLAGDLAITALIDTLEHGSGAARVSAANSLLDRGGNKSLDKWFLEIVDKLKISASANNRVTHSEAIAELLGAVLEASEEARGNGNNS